MDYRQKIISGPIWPLTKLRIRTNIHFFLVGGESVKGVFLPLYFSATEGVEKTSIWKDAEVMDEVVCSGGIKAEGFQTSAGLLG